MRLLFATMLLAATAVAQQGPDELPNGTPTLQPRTQQSNATPADSKTQEPQVPWYVPAGTKVPLVLKHAISTKNAKPGDNVYAQTTFPVVVNGQVVIPAGTYVQGRISQVKRPGRVKGKGEMLFNFTTLVYPNGYTVILPSSIDQVPGLESGKIKDDEGTVQGEGSKGRDATIIGTGAAIGGNIGAASTSSIKGAAIGGIGGAAVGTLATLFTRGKDLRIEAGSAVEMILNRAIAIDSKRVPAIGTSQAAYPMPH